ERRLAYVALTRPARLLVASGHWWGPSQKTLRGPSSYLAAVRESALQAGDVPIWEPMPLEEDNPVLTDQPQYAWPAPASAAAAANLAGAGELVREFLDTGDREPGMEVESSEQLTSAQRDLLAQWDDDVQALLDDSATSAGITEAQVPLSLSATDVVNMAKDPQSFAQFLVRPMPRRPSAAAARGTRFHEWVAQRFEQPPLFEDIPGAADAEPYEDGDMTALQEAFWRSEFATRVPVALEVPFSLVLGGRVIFGRIDAVYRDGGRWQIIDWKTNRAARSDPLQLAIYRAAWAHMQGCDIADVDCAFVYVRSGETVWFEDLPGGQELAEVMTG
ncbi:MAG: PD-(D/E)XK nuclease family protein, partial [Actinomycetes bacterium]